MLETKELPEIYLSLTPCFLRGKNRSNETPCVPSNTSQTSFGEVARLAVSCCIWGGWRASCLHRERVEGGRAPRCCSSLGTSGEEEGLDWSNLAIGSGGQSRDMGTTCEHVVALNGNVLKQVRFDTLRWLIFLHQHRLALLKPEGSKTEARQVITQATAFK